MLDCTVCIVGAGYSGINALNACVKYLKKGDRVVVIDRGNRWGGTFSHAYDHVRLHQPYKQFTAGEREWAIAKTKPDEYLASKLEILTHFDDIVHAACEESGIELVYLWGYEADVLNVEKRGREKLFLHGRALERLGQDVSNVEILADKVINCSGFDVKPMESFVFARNVDVHSYNPRTILSASARAHLQYSNSKEREIWIVGSGKTALDTILALSKLGESVRNRIRCIAGRGTYFVNRNRGPELGDFSLQALHMYGKTGDGMAVMKEFDRQGFLHSPIPDAGSCVFGFCSEEEVANTARILSPTSQKILKGHLMDVVQGPRLKIRNLDGTVTFHSIQPGSFIVNCTDNLKENANVFSPIVSHDGLLLSPQNILGFSGQSSHFMTHGWFLGIINQDQDSIWRSLPRISFDSRDKTDIWLKLLFCVTMSTQMVALALPRQIGIDCKAVNRSPASAPSPQSQKLIPEIISLCLARFTATFDDPPSTTPIPQFAQIYGGNLEQSRL